MFGGQGADTLDGGLGDDRLHGNQGADIFIFSRHGDSDQIADFQVGEDRLALRDFEVAGSIDHWTEQITVTATEAGDAMIVTRQTEVVTLLGVRPAELEGHNWLIWD